MSTHVTTLDALIRKRATDELAEEVKAAFRALILTYFGGSVDRNEVIVSFASSAVTEVAAPKEGFRIDIVSLETFLVAKAISNEAARRGDKAVAGFMERVESVEHEIRELRDEVIG